MSIETLEGRQLMSATALDAPASPSPGDDKSEVSFQIQVQPSTQQAGTGAKDKMGNFEIQRLMS